VFKRLLISLEKRTVDLQSHDDGHESDKDVAIAVNNEDVSRCEKVTPLSEASATINHRIVAGAEASRRGGLAPGIRPTRDGPSSSTTAAGVDQSSAHQISAPAAA
jgi:hypothetical protein